MKHFEKIKGNCCFSMNLFRFFHRALPIFLHGPTLFTPAPTGSKRDLNLASRLSCYPCLFIKQVFFMLKQVQTQKQQHTILPQQIELLNLFHLNTLELEQRI